MADERNKEALGVGGAGLEGLRRLGAGVLRGVGRAARPLRVALEAAERLGASAERLGASAEFGKAATTAEPRSTPRTEAVSPRTEAVSPPGRQGVDLGRTVAPVEPPKTAAVKPPSPTGQPIAEPQAIYWDPFALIEQLGYKEKPTALTYGTLEAIVWKNPIVRAIIKTRVDQVATFCQAQRPPQEPGLRVRLRETTRTPTRAEVKEARRIEEWLLTTGTVVKDRRERHGMEYLVRQIVNDSLTYDQVNIEIVPDRRGLPSQWYAVDPATVRFVDSARLGPDHDMDAPYCVQIYDNVVIGEFTRREMVFAIRNPRSNIRSHGYGTCLHPDTMVRTATGLHPVRELAQGDGRFEAEIGRRVVPARAYPTGRKRLWRLRLTDGGKLLASPDHRLLVLDGPGRFVWRRLEEVRGGDAVALDGQESSESLTSDSQSQWHHARVESVVDVVDLGEEIEMFDVEVFDDAHAFVAEGLVVHNSEAEMMVSTITYLLWGMDYNGAYFSQGAIPKGLLNIKGTIPEKQLRAFRRQWYQLVAGVENQFRTPIVNADDIAWVPLDKSNRDMEFSQWLDFLIKIACFPGDQRVQMKDGTTRPIREITPGDEVLTHTGRARRVVNVQRRRHRGPLVRIKVPYSGEILCTPGHPFRTIRGGQKQGGVRRFDARSLGWTRAEDLEFRPGGSSFAREQDYLVSPVPPAGVESTGRAEHAWEVPGGWALKIREYGKTADVDCDVYNLQVEDDESYVLEGGVAVHNCAIYAIDPIEVNFKYGGQGGRAMFEAANKVKLVESKAKGLQPLLRFIERVFNENVIWPVTEDFTLEFTGLSPMTAKELADLDTQRVRTYMTVNEVRGMHDLPPLPGDLGDVINDPNWMEARREKLLQEQQEQAMGAGGAGAEEQQPQSQQGEPQQSQESSPPGQGVAKKSIEVVL